MSDCRLKFKECVDCKEWNGNRTHCANICSKPYAAWDGFNRYMELEEQGLLIRLPCKVGDIVYQITRNFISTYRIRNFIHYNNGNIFFDWECINGIYVNVQGFHIDDVGKTVFLTREEAEAALERMV